MTVAPGGASAPSAHETKSARPPIEPWDEHNQRLLANVRPAGWVNPHAGQRYHLVVIGAGTGGLVTASVAAALGARVALVERHLMGGDCLNVGCVPSKAMLRAARGWSAARESEGRFGGPSVDGAGDFASVMERLRRIRADISPVDGAPRFRDLGVDVFLGEGRFTGPDTVEVEGQTLRFRRAVVATGGRSLIPNIPGLVDAGYLTNETVFSLTELPPRLAIIGAGPIGCELAQAFARLGSRVTLLERDERILPHTSREAGEVIARALRHDGVEILTGVEVSGATRAGAERRLTYARGVASGEVVTDALLVAAGRVPNVEGLGLEAAGVLHGPQGVQVDDRMRTTSSRIFAIGDIASRFQFTHAADAQARMVVQNALFFGRARLSALVVPWCTYTSPELAHVGLTAAAAAARGVEVETITVPMREVDRARLDDATEGFLRLYLRPGSDRILGATLVSEHAGEIISLITMAMVHGFGLNDLGKTIFPYPTQAEVVRRAADAHRRKKLTPTAKRAFERFFRLLG